MGIGDEHGYTRYRGLIGKAIRLLRNGVRLPLDLQVLLLLIGVDIDRLEKRYGT